jgi:glycosyltransferase involved in cell wall biosynthesis
MALVYHAPAARELAFFRARLPWRPRRLAWYLLEPLLRLLERVAVQQATRVFTFSEYTSNLLKEEHLAATVRVSRLVPGVDVVSFAPGDGQAAARAKLGISPEERLLLTVRRFEPRMGLERLFEAVKMLVSSNVTIAVVGTGPLESKLRRSTKRLRLENVRFLGRLDDVDLAEWYRAADLFVLPTIAYEGFGLVTAEALASGTPVIGTAVGATPELLRPLDGRLIADPSTAVGIRDAIERGLKLAGPDLRRRSRDYAQMRFAWEHVIADWERALDETVTAPLLS